ncbi:MAG TPA: molybdate ABC transporter substrate-binding protein [Gaiellaceae bacterium]|nr:molybdate ABC transporter substrate-binding protein [Gaiellaceae bacterium]
MRRRALGAAAAVALALAAAGAYAATRSSSTTPRLTVFAAASLTDVLPRIDATARYSFGGSNALAAQIRQGLPADVFASANTALPERLFREGRVERPVVFTANALVLIARKGNPERLHGVRDLRRPGLRLAVGAAGVPVGDYTRTVLGRLGLARLVAGASQETDVREVLAKVALGELDAGFVYATDAKSVQGKVAVLALPRSSQPTVRYAAAVVKASGNRAAAERWVARLRGARAQRQLRAAGFLPSGR